MPPGKEAEVPTGIGFILCYDQGKILAYDWRDGICRETITVTWSTDDRNAITHVDASYHEACL